MKRFDDAAGCAGLTLAQLAAQNARAASATIQQLQAEARSLAFVTLGDLIQDWLSGKIRFVACADEKLSGDPAKTLERCRKAGFAFEDLKLKKDQPMEEVLLACHAVVADLAYLALKNLIVPEPLGYAAPESRGIAAVLDVKALKARFPEFGGMITPIPETLAVPAVIAAVDAVVLVVDYVRAKQ